MRRISLAITLSLFATLLCRTASAQFGVGLPQASPQYELVDAAGVVSATIQIAPGRLIAYEANGERVYYSRDNRYDSPDGRYLGYTHFGLNRVLRFPRSGRGRLMGVDLDLPFPRYSYLARTVRPIRGFAAPPSAYLPPTNYGAPFQGLGAGGGPYLNPYDNSGFGTAVAPLSPGLGRPLGFPRLAPQSVLIDSQVIPRPPLAPVTVMLFNGGPREIRVTVDDLTDAAQSRQYKIAAGARQPITVKRDSGADRIDTFRTVSWDGTTITREVTHPVPPQVRYELVVHEWNLQSIAIDRTGKSPHPIEDVHYQGRGLGRYPLPPGDQLKSGTIDAYRAAKEANNPGAVAPIQTRPQNGATEKSGLSPLERVLLEQQRAAQRRK